MAFDGTVHRDIDNFLGGILSPKLAAITPEVLDRAFADMEQGRRSVTIMDRGPHHRVLLTTLGGIECVQRFEIGPRGVRSETTILGTQLDQLGHHSDLAADLDRLLTRAPVLSAVNVWWGEDVIVELVGGCVPEDPLRLVVSYGPYIGSSVARH